MEPVLVRCLPTAPVVWQAANATLPAGDVAVYAIRIAGFAPQLDVLTSELTPDERERAARYHRPADTRRFTVARATLRRLLARYTGQSAETLRIVKGEHQKPELTDFPNVQFSVSHTIHYVLIAIGYRSVRALGVDVEFVNPAFDYAGVLAATFSTAGQRSVLTAPDPRRAFYEGWTRKESLLKATGRGLTNDLPAIPDVAGEHYVAANLLGTTSDWTVRSFSVGDDHVGALALPAGDVAVRFIVLNAW